jgi:hypothetical protein
MPIQKIQLTNTFNEFRQQFNDTADAVNSIDDGTGDVSANNVTANNVTGTEHIYSGPDAETWNTENEDDPTIHKTLAVGDTDGPVDVAVVNKNAGTDAYSEFLAINDVGNSAQGWISVGINSSGYDDPEFLLTKADDGYLLFEAPEGTSGSGDLVIATGGNGTSNKIVFGAGGFETGNTQMEIVPDTKVDITIGTQSTSVDTGALTVAGGFGLQGNLNVGEDSDPANIAFTVEASSGNTHIVGTLNVGDNVVVGEDKFTVDASTGDIVATGNLELTFEESRIDAYHIHADWHLGAGGDVEEWAAGKGTDVDSHKVFGVGDADAAVDMLIANQNDGADAYAEFIAVNDTGTIDDGWCSLGINSSNYAESAYGVTKADDGYILFQAPANTAQPGDLVIGTGGNGTSNRIIFSANGFDDPANNTQMVITPGEKVEIEIDTESSNTATGALVVRGGIGLEGNLNVGGDVNIVGNITLGGTGNTIGLETLAVDSPIVFVGNANPSDLVDLGIVGQYKVGGTTRYTGVVRDATDGVYKIFANTSIEPETTVNFSDPNLNYPGVQLGNATLLSTTPSTSTTTGALTVAGGVGVAGNAYVGGLIRSSDTTTSTSVTTGSVVLSGGVGVTGNTNITGNYVTTLGKMQVTVGGSAASPAFTTTGANTGMYINGTVLGLSTNGTRAVDFDSLGQANFASGVGLADFVPNESTALGITRTYDSNTTRNGILQLITLSDVNIFGTVTQFNINNTLINLQTDHYEDEGPSFSNVASISDITCNTNINSTVTVTFNESYRPYEQRNATNITAQGSGTTRTVRFNVPDAYNYSVGDTIIVANTGGTINGTRTVGAVTATYVQITATQTINSNGSLTVWQGTGDIRLGTHLITIQGVTPTTRNTGVNHHGFNGAWTALRTSDTTCTFTLQNGGVEVVSPDGPNAYVSGGALRKNNRWTQTLYGDFTTTRNGTSSTTAGVLLAAQGAVTNQYGGRFDSINAAGNTASCTVTNNWGMRAISQNLTAGRIAVNYGVEGTVTQTLLDGQTDTAYAVFGKVNPDNGRLLNSYGGYFWTELDGGFANTAWGVFSRVDRDGGVGGDAYLFRGSLEGAWGSNTWGLYMTTQNANTVPIYIANSGGVEIFGVDATGTIRSTNPSIEVLSDIRLKQDIIDASSQWDDIKSIKIRKYRLKDSVAKNPDAPYQLGVIAQEVEQISPGLIGETRIREDYDEPVLDNFGVQVVNEDGEPVYNHKDRETGDSIKNVKYTIIYLKAVKALQEAMERIEALEEEVQKLKSKL